MIGAIVGDVLGSVYERARAQTKRKDFRLYRAEDRATDDSVLTLAVARTILLANQAPAAADNVPRIPAEADFAKNLREIGRRYPRAGYGGSFHRWLDDEKMGPYSSWGNGSAMRASAVGWAYENAEDVLYAAEQSARPTHNHPEGIKGAQAVALAVFLARKGAARGELRLEIARRFGYDLDRTVDEIRPGYKFEISCQLSVPESIIAFLDSVDFEDAIRNAISLGGDADTQACIAGAVAEAHYGGVPQAMLAWVLPRLDELQFRIAREFALRFMSGSQTAETIERFAEDRLTDNLLSGRQLPAGQGRSDVSDLSDVSEVTDLSDMPGRSALPDAAGDSDEFEQSLRSIPEYRILLSGETWKMLENYAGRLKSGHGAGPGRRVAEQLELLTRAPYDKDGSETTDADRRPVTTELLIDVLVNSKRPRIFAESEVKGDGSDWTAEELGLLGDLGIAVPVTIFDDGRHFAPKVHTPPLRGTLLFVPGALLRADSGNLPADWDAVVSGGRIDQERYTALYERRLVPLLSYASARSLAVGRKALVTIPGLGCGQFSGQFRGSMGVHLSEALRVILKRHAGTLSGIRTVWFDPYSECGNERYEIGSISYLVRPLQKNSPTRPQLCRPVDFEEPGDDYSGCDLFSVVAWDHVSWPGNDFYAGARSTDDGVKAAASDSMRVMTGFTGSYNRRNFMYEPPADSGTWGSIVLRQQLRIATRGTTMVVGRVNDSSGQVGDVHDLKESDDGTA
jgi:ADP-ribosylglycohydrolase